MKFHDDWFIKTEIEQVSKTKEVVNKWIKKLPKNDLENLSTRGQYSKQYMLKNAFETEETFQFILENCAKKITEEFEKRIGRDPEISLNNAWTVIGNTNSFHAVHRHKQVPEKIISTVMYLSAPTKNMNDKKLLDRGEFYYFLNKQDNRLLFNSIYPKTNDFFYFSLLGLAWDISSS